jgi:hypothetical protein
MNLRLRAAGKVRDLCGIDCDFELTFHRNHVDSSKSKPESVENLGKYGKSVQIFALP